MKQENIALAKIVLNDSNPRTITDEKFNKLVESILVFPKMLELRPVVIDDKNIALGGNMRTRALHWISTATQTQIEEHLQLQSKYRTKTEFEQKELVAFWLKWKKKPTVPCVFAQSLTDEERNEFIVKDNVGFGIWDMDMLANEFDEKLLDDWGMDVWQMDDDSDGDGGDGDKHGSLQNKFTVHSAWISKTNPKELKSFFTSTLEESGFNVLNVSEHHFKPQGYTALWLLSESHFAVHTFPEYGKSYIELSSCNMEYYAKFLELTKDM